MISSKTRLIFRITAILLAVLFALVLLFLFALCMESTMVGVVMRVDGDRLLVVPFYPSTFGWLSGSKPTEVSLNCGDRASRFNVGDIILAHTLGGTLDMQPLRMSAKFVFLLY